MRIDVDELDLVSDRFVEAAVDPSLWSSLLERSAAATGSFGANIVPIFGTFPGNGATSDSLVPIMDVYFREEWQKRDFRAQHLPILRRTGMLLEQDYAGADEFAGQDFYRSLARFGLRWTAALAFTPGPDLVTFVLQRKIDDGPYVEEEVAILRKVRQKLTVAGAVMRTMADVRMQGMAEAFEMASIGCVFVGPDGKVVLVNARARALLGNELQITAGRLQARNSLENRALDAMLSTILAGGVSFAPNSADVVLIARADRRPLIVRMQRLSGPLLDGLGTASALVLIDAPETARPVDRALLVAIFDLSPREAEIASILAAGIGPGAIAEQLQITYETVRSHTRSIFRKTNTTSQSGLVALLAQMRT